MIFPPVAMSAMRIGEGRGPLGQSYRAAGAPVGGWVFAVALTRDDDPGEEGGARSGVGMPNGPPVFLAEARAPLSQNDAVCRGAARWRAMMTRARGRAMKTRPRAGGR